MREKKPSASLAFVPEDAELEELVHAARSCHACDLYKRATQTVFGEGPMGRARSRDLSPSALLRMIDMIDDRPAYEKAKDELQRDLATAASLVTFRRTRGRVAAGLRKHVRMHAG